MNVLVIDYQSPQAPEQFARSLKETGFAVLKNHGVPMDLFQRVKKEWQDFFAADEKFNFLYDKNAYAQDGYIPAKVAETAKGNPVKDLKEFYQVYPRGRMPERASKDTWEMFHTLYDIGFHLLEWLQENTPAEVKAKFSMPLPEMADPVGNTMLRIIHYPPLSQDAPAGAIRAAAHEDINFLTILPASDEPGLEAKDLNGNWHTVPCDPGMIVINAGDPLQMCSEHYYKSTTHRVRNPDESRRHIPRYSFPLFLHIKPEVVLNTKTGFTMKEYLIQRLQELGLR
jgi:isopenicillin N synthase-like dioxygenase